MNNHLSVMLRGKYLALLPDTAIDIEDANPYFNDTQETYTYSFDIPIEGNRAVLSNIDDLRSTARLTDHEHSEMTLIVDGIPLRHGKVSTTEGQEISDRVSISMTSNVKSLTDYFDKLTCRDIPIKDRIEIGEMIGNLKATFSAQCQLRSKQSGKTGFLSWSWKRKAKDLGSTNGDVQIELPALGYSVPGVCSEDDHHFADGAVSTDGSANGKDPTYIKKFINVTEAYPEAPYCNARVCYMHYKKNDDGTSSDIVDLSATGDNSRFNPYLVLEADRPQSGICFYVLYFLDCLFNFLRSEGISYDNSRLLTEPDMLRLAFFTTRCRYSLERKYPASDDAPDYTSLADINRWLSSRNTGGKIEVRWEKSKSIGGISYNGRYYAIGDVMSDGTKLDYANIETSDVEVSVSANIMKMYANSQNFPDEPVQSIIDSLWASFGIRFYLDQASRRVTPLFIRDIFRDHREPIMLHCTLLRVHKISEKTTGVHMKYEAESDRREQQRNMTDGVRDYDTRYDYIDYDRIDTSLTYRDIIKRCGVSDLTLYVDLTTGNRYRIKVDGEATTQSEFHPTVFEVGKFKGVEIGDCSEENSDYVEELTSGFTPIDFNDVNGRFEASAGDETTTEVVSDQTGERAYISSVNAHVREQVLAAFIDHEMWHEFCERKIQTAFGDDYVDMYLVESARTREAFNPDDTTDGTSPLQDYDWGTSIAVMRGGGTDATIEYYDYDYDGFGSSKWRTRPGIYGMSSDSIDSWGALYDYNGSAPGIGPERRFSLKIRAYITDPASGQPLCREQVARRGLYDTFMAEYTEFVLHRTRLRLTLLCEVSELQSIQWARRYSIGGYVGWIDKISTHITMQNGIESVTIDMFVL